MEQIFSYLFFVIIAIMGGGTSLFLVISLPAVIIWKAAAFQSEFSDS